jgi:hypothetical protein
MKPGFFLEMSAAQYHADPCPEPSLSQSIAKILLARSPAHAWTAHPRLNPNYVLDAEGYEADRIIGEVAHKLMLGRGRDVAQMSVTNFRTKAAQEERDAAFDAGVIPVLPHHYERASAMVEAGRSQLKAMGLDIAMEAGEHEAVMCWQENKVWFRSMLDCMFGGSVLDYKTTGLSIAPHVIDRKMFTDGVHIQAAFHERGLDVLDPGGAGKRQHTFIFQENEPPYPLIAIPLSEEWMTHGRRAVARAIGAWRHCLTTRQWPMYPIDTPCPPFPSWGAAREIEAEAFTEPAPEAAADHLMGG